MTAWKRAGRRRRVRARAVEARYLGRYLRQPPPQCCWAHRATVSRCHSPRAAERLDTQKTHRPGGLVGLPGRCGQRLRRWRLRAGDVGAAPTLLLRVVAPLSAPLSTALVATRRHGCAAGAQLRAGGLRAAGEHLRETQGRLSSAGPSTAAGAVTDAPRVARREPTWCSARCGAVA